MRLERRKNAVRGIATGFANKTVTLCLPFLVQTILIQKIGIEYAGLNGLFASILHILNLTELGFSEAVVHSMYKPIAEDDKESICALLCFYRKVYFVIGLVILGTGMLLLPFLPKLIKGNCPEDVNLYCLYLIYLMNTSIGYLLFGYKTSIMNAFQRVDIINNISTLTSTLLNVTQIVLLITAKSYFLYTVVMPFFTILNNLFISVEVKKRFPQYICRGEISTEMKGDMRKKVSGLMLQRVCAATRNTMDNIFISAFLGLSITAMYSNYYYIKHAVTILMGIIITSMLGGIGNSVQMESREANFTNMCRFDFMYMWLSSWFTTVLLCLYQPFMKLWMGTEYMFGFPVVILLCIYFYALKMGDVRSLYYQSAGLWWEGKWRALVELVMNVSLNFLLVQVMGICGIILATLIALISVNFFYGSRFVFKYYFGMEKLKKYYQLHGLYSVVTLLCCTVTYFFCEMFGRLCPIRNELISLFFRGIICVLIPNLFLLLVYAKTKMFQDMVQWLKRKGTK